MTFPLWIPLFAIGLGLLGIGLMVKSLPTSSPIDEELTESNRQAQIDAAFRTHGQSLLQGHHVVRADFQRGNRT